VSTSARRTQRERSTASAKSLIAAAIELIAEQGFERTTAAQIGERAGYSREMVRHRYGSKERLLEVLLEEEHSNLLLLAPEAQAGTGRERALAQVGQWREVAQREPEQLLAFLVLCFEAVGPIPNLGPWMRDWFASYREQLAAALHDGITDGSVRPDLDAPTEATDVAYYGIGLCFSFVLHRELAEFVAAFERLDGRLRENWQPA
jgi:AcrR family transcriptional regulator